MSNNIQYFSHARPEMANLVNTHPQRILEVGCGTGNFMTNFPQAEYWGVEPNQEAASIAEKSLTRVILGYYDQIQDKIPDAHFDLIVCNDVIEHMPDPKGFLCSIKSKLAPGGKLIASVPNLRNAMTLYDLLVKGTFNYADAGILDYTHYHLFTLKSFKLMAEECGWTVEMCTPVNKQPFKLVKRMLLSFAVPLFPEIKFLQIGSRLRPASRQ